MLPCWRSPRRTSFAAAAESGVCACTNHFRTPELATSKFCRRYPLLDPGQQADKLGLDDLAHKLDQVNQGGLTIQTMIFEPQTLKLHLSLGKHASSRPLKVLDLTRRSRQADRALTILAPLRPFSPRDFAGTRIAAASNPRN